MTKRISSAEAEFIASAKRSYAGTFTCAPDTLAVVPHSILFLQYHLVWLVYPAFSHVRSLPPLSLSLVSSALSLLPLRLMFVSLLHFTMVHRPWGNLAISVLKCISMLKQGPLNAFDIFLHLGNQVLGITIHFPSV